MSRGPCLGITLLIAVCLSLLAAPIWAQGVQTGALTGTVMSADKLVLPGVTVTVKSPSLQGVRSAKTDSQGAFIFKALPAGDYTITFEKESMAAAERKSKISLGETLSLDITMEVAGPTEVLTVSAGPDTAPVETASGGQNFRAQEIDKLAMARDPVTIAAIAPGLDTNTPNANQLAISGAFAYETQFLIDGVDVADNVFGTLNQVFIEDAIEEVQVLTSGVSAEYGRFGGGVINTITKSGGNQFSGSFRTDIANPHWVAQTPFEISSHRPVPRSDIQPAYQATLGGYIVRDHLWFFGAGRLQNQTLASTFPETGIAYDDVTKDKRYELKLTGSINPQHTFQVTYTKQARDRTRPSLPNSLVPAALEHPSFPDDLFVARYNGTLRSDLLVEAQYSVKREGFRNSGGSSTDIHDSPFLPLTLPGLAYNGPYFDSTDPEDRNNRQITGAISYFLSTKSLGHHDLKLGFENFRTLHTGGNSQSPTNYVFYADYLTDASGAPVCQVGSSAPGPCSTTNDQLIPVFTPGSNLALNWRAVRGAELSITTNSFYLNDRWTWGRHWTFNLGARYEQIRSSATGGLVGLNTDTIVPRLAASFDVKGDGKWHVDLTYAHYAGKYNDVQFGNNTNVGNPNLIYGLYTGPAGQGRDFAPGFDVANYQTVGGFFPTANARFASNLSSPVTKEFTLGLGHSFDRGYLKAIYVHRRVTNFVEDFTDLSNGITTVTENGVDLVTLTNRLYENSNAPKREYDAVQLLGQYRVIKHLWLTAGYTLQLHNWGNFEGEAASQPGLSSGIGDFPPILVADRNYPTGTLSSFQRHKLRVYGDYDFTLGSAGTLDVGLLYSFDSPLSFSYSAAKQPLSDTQIASDPGYPDPPTSQTIFFGDRGIGGYNSSHIFDLAANYSIPIVNRVHPFVKVQVRNILGSMPLTSFNTTIVPDWNGPVDANGIPTTYTQGSKFGQGTSNSNYPDPRTFLFTLGFTF